MTDKHGQPADKDKPTGQTDAVKNATVKKTAASLPVRAVPTKRTQR